MKRIIFSVFAIFLIPSLLFAQKTLPMTHFGCELGKTTRTEAKQKFRKAGYKLISEQQDTIIYMGKFRFSQYNANQCILTFAGDTLYCVSLYDEANKTTSKTHQNFYQSLYADYGSLKDIPVEKVCLVLQQNLMNFSSNAWSKTDNNFNIIIYSYNEKTGQSILAFENESWYLGYAARYILNKFYETLKDVPDYNKDNKVTSIAGVSFGDERHQVNTFLDHRFNQTGIQDYRQNSIMYYNVMIGGIQWKVASFIFGYNKQSKNQELIVAKLECVFPIDEYENALQCYEIVRGTYANKYSNEKCLDKSAGEKFCAYGMLSPDYNFNFPIIVRLFKGQSRGGELYYYVEVSYFLLRLSEQMNNDI